MMINQITSTGGTDGVLNTLRLLEFASSAANIKSAVEKIAAERAKADEAIAEAARLGQALIASQVATAASIDALAEARAAIDRERTEFAEFQNSARQEIAASRAELEQSAAGLSEQWRRLEAAKIEALAAAEANKKQGMELSAIANDLNRDRAILEEEKTAVAVMSGELNAKLEKLRALAS